MNLFYLYAPYKVGTHHRYTTYIICSFDIRKEMPTLQPRIIVFALLEEFGSSLSVEELAGLSVSEDCDSSRLRFFLDFGVGLASLLLQPSNSALVRDFIFPLETRIHSLSYCNCIWKPRNEVIYVRICIATLNPLNIDQCITRSKST